MLGLWTNGFDFIIAEGADDAQQILREQPSSEGLSDEELEQTGWQRRPRLEWFSMHGDVAYLRDGIQAPPGATVRITASVGDWIRTCGRGYLACTEW